MGVNFAGKIEVRHETQGPQYMTDIQQSPTQMLIGRQGLLNVGNTCYLNSAVQFLRHSTALQALFATTAWQSYCSKDRKGFDLIVETTALFRALNTPSTHTASSPSYAPSSLNPLQFAREFMEFGREFNDRLAIGEQADAAEAVQIILDALHTQLARKVRMTMTLPFATNTPDARALIRSLETWDQFFSKEYSPIVAQFFGQTQTAVTCSGCKAVTTRYEPWNMLKLPIPAKPDLVIEDCIEASLASDTLDDFQCDTCNKRGPAVIHNAISRFPNQLILMLKRFNNMGAKVRSYVDYDEEIIDMSPWRAWPTYLKKQQYRVVATIEHAGRGVRGGHYSMRARDPIRESVWHMYDDDRVWPINDGGATPDTYMLMLERCPSSL